MTDAARDKWREVRAMDTAGTLPLGPNTFDRFIHDPKRLGFYSARYSFAAKMLQGCGTIIDIGCGDGFFDLTLLTDTDAHWVLGVDFDEALIRYAAETLLPAFNAANPNRSDRVDFMHADFLSPNGPFQGWDGAVSMDCIEHIEPDDAPSFIQRMAAALSPNGVAVIGTPNQYASHFASPHSKVGHINLYTPDRLREAMQVEFPRVFMFGMNDGTLNMGHEQLWHYVIGVGVKG